MVARPDSGEPDHNENIPVGIALMSMTMFFFVVLDTLAKYLMQFYPVVQVIWGRFFFHTILLSIILVATRSNLKKEFRSRRPGLQIWRSVLMLATNGLFFYSIKYIDLATATTIMFLSPIFVTILAIPILGESVGFRRWIGVMIGFVGAVIIVRPGLGVFDTGILVLLLAAFSHSFYQIFTRQVRIYDSPITSLLYTGLVGAVVMSMVAPFQWQWPTMTHWILFLFLGITGIIGHFCLIRALRVAPASVVSPFSYSSLIWATGFSYFFFGELPDYWVFIGGFLIVASGLYILHRERAASRAG